MNREAVALGTPVYTIFSGRMGAVDESLIAARPPAPARPTRRDLELVKRDRPGPARATRRDAGELLVDAVLERGLMFVDGRPETIYALFAFLRRGSPRLAAGPGGRADRVADRRRSTTRTSAACTTTPTPKLGGLAIFVGVLVAALLFLPWALQTQALLAGAVVIAAVGVLDDVFELSRAAQARRADGGGGDPGAQRRQRQRRSRSRSSAASTCARSSSSSRAADRQRPPRPRADDHRDRRGDQRDQPDRRRRRARRRGLRDLRRRRWR